MPKIKINQSVLCQIRDACQTIVPSKSRQTRIATITGSQHKTAHQQHIDATTVVLDEVSYGNSSDAKTGAERLQVSAKYTEPLLADSPLLCGTIEDYKNLVCTLQKNCRSIKSAACCDCCNALFCVPIITDHCVLALLSTCSNCKLIGT